MPKDSCGGFINARFGALKEGVLSPGKAGTAEKTCQIFIEKRAGLSAIHVLIIVELGELSARLDFLDLQMKPVPAPDVTGLLQAWQAGDEYALVVLSKSWLRKEFVKGDHHGA